MASSASEVEIVVLGVAPEETPGRDRVGSNGVTGSAPLIPKTAIHVAAVSDEESVAVIVVALSAEGAAAYHSSRSRVAVAVLAAPTATVGMTPAGGFALARIQL